MNFTEKKLLNEIQRFREIIGLPPILTEGREKLLSSVGDLKKAAIDAFGTAGRMTPEGVFAMKIQSAADETAIAKILRDPANVRFTKKLIGDTLMISGGRASQTIEFMIKRAYDKGHGKDKIMSDMKTKVNEWFDSPYLDDIIDYYEGSILEVYGGRNADDVFGRKVENPNPKKGSSSSTPPKVDLAAAKKSLKSMTDNINNSELKEYLNKEIENLNEDTLPVDAASWVRSKMDGIAEILKKSKDVELELLQKNQQLIAAKANNILNENLPKKIKTLSKTGWALIGLGLVIGIAAIVYGFYTDPVGEYESWKEKFTDSAKNSGMPEQSARKAADEAVETGKEIRKKGKGSYIKRK